jgi:UDP-N-acetylmuramate dehydrogenase
MALSPSTAEALTRAGVDWLADAPLARKTWWRTGGAADAYVEARDRATVERVTAVAAATGASLFVLGNASNLLISDGGVRGIVLRLGGALAEIGLVGAVQRPILELGGGLGAPLLVRRAGTMGWTGLECLAGVPGTIGGAVRMNAGTKLGEASDTLVEVELVVQGESSWVPASALELGYRQTTLPPSAVITAARFQTTGADPHESRRHVEEHLAYRAATQPVDVRTCGSTFRNPDGDAAGRLIEAAGLKGTSIGAAQVSPKHANFIVNTGGAMARDIRALIEHVQAVVHAEHGVRLVREVHYAGSWDRT